MPSCAGKDDLARPVSEWALLPAATLGSSVRARGLFLEVRARLPIALKKLIHIEARVLSLRVPENFDGDVQAAISSVTRSMRDIESVPVIPREVEDILAIKASERHRWLKDGRLRSAGTRTVKLRGRARKITFHVFDPRDIEDILDRDLVSHWRDDDAIKAADNRRRAAAMAAELRARKKRDGGPAPTVSVQPKSSHAQLKGWDDFEIDGLLR